MRRLVIGLETCQMSLFPKTLSDAVFSSRFAETFQGFLEKFSRGPKPAFINGGGAELQNRPGIGRAQCSENSERVFKMNAGFGDLLLLQRNRAQLVKAPCLANR